MNRTISRIFCIISLCTLFLGEVHAQKKSIGSTFSYAGIGIVYEHRVDDKNFAEIQIRTETAAMFTKGGIAPGVSASFSWNMVFAGIELRDGNRAEIFAGPGAYAGLADDAVNGKGLVLGLKGRIGGECTFRRNIAISISISPVLGLHLGSHDGMTSMLLFKSGLLYGIMPEIGIKYAF